jgi:anti-anti-sigma factor
MQTTDGPRFRAPEPFRCHVRRDGDTARLRLSGELDVDTAAAAEEALRALRGAGATRIVLDLRGLEFMDSTGLRLALRWDAMARADGFAFAIVPGTGPVRRLLDLTGTAERFLRADPE